MEEMDERLKKEVGSAARRSREADDRPVTERREISDDERLEMFRRTMFNDVLPNLPDIPGYHVCWLSTRHSTDTISRRERLGYTPVKPEDAPGMEHTTLKTGDYAGLIGVNEMLAYKLPMSLYLRFMQEAHHDAPARDAMMIASQADQLKEQAARDGGEIMEGDGMADLRRSAPSRGIFSDR